MFDWSNTMIGSQDPEYQTGEEASQQAAMELYAYASELFATKRIDPHEDLMSVLTEVEMEGEKLNEIELELFFLLLTVAGNETTRNLISGGMAAFFDHPDQWELLRNDRSLLPSAVEEMLRYVDPGDELPTPDHQCLRPGGQHSTRTPRWSSPHLGEPGRSGLHRPAAFDITRNPNPHLAFGRWPHSAWAPTWPAWRSGSCSSTCSTGCPTSGSTAPCSGCSPSSSTASSTFRSPSRPPPALSAWCLDGHRTT